MRHRRRLVRVDDFLQEFTVVLVVFPDVKQVVDFLLEELGRRADAVCSAKEPLEGACDGFRVLA